MFKEANQKGNLVSVGIGSDEFTKGAKAIADGKNIQFDGASGPLLWDVNGNRKSQGMRTFKVNKDGNAFEVDKQYKGSEILK